MIELLNTLFFYGLLLSLLLLIVALAISCFAALLTGRRQQLRDEIVQVNPYR